ncbi:hypothetical protein BCV70DRAFT_201239 [Testicularia cyperi]|uniref:Uncharacterized protein n=1 Tax=Testicularia cyperi TaxID=1882483 RepID=A0A317XMF3_9BASI|nr:hypothetical protein BCV70DRAFT_201239 [Testicularia cyperi]
MAISLDSAMDASLNTVAVVPLDVSRGVSGSRNASSSRLAIAGFLSRAAANLCHAVAQGSSAEQQDSLAPADASGTHGDDDDDDEGGSSFTYSGQPSADVSDVLADSWVSTVPWHISNRYYDVDVVLKTTQTRSLATTPLRVGQPAHSTGDNAEDATDANHPGSFSGAPAYVLVVDRTSSLDQHRQAIQYIEANIASGFDADISIVAGITSVSSATLQPLDPLDSSSSTASEVSKPPTTSDLVALYADAGWEFIPLDEGAEDEGDSTGGSDAQDDSDGYSEEDHDQDGIERIREALMNHMWNGLVRKEDRRNALGHQDARSDPALAQFTSRGFSDALDSTLDGDDAEESTSHSADGTDNNVPVAARRPPTLEDLLKGTALPDLGLDTHAAPDGLDEKLAQLFLSQSNEPRNLAELEAFLESEDPSWPSTSGASKDFDAVTTGSGARFEDDFDDFLPFQSGTRTGSAPTDASFQQTPDLHGRDGRDENDTDALPSNHEIADMQTRLFGSNAASRLESGPLGLGPAASAHDQHDFAAQLQQLQFHTERVRGIQDPDRRRKEAALVALAFSMQWGDGDDPTTGSAAGGMNF